MCRLSLVAIDHYCVMFLFFIIIFCEWNLNIAFSAIDHQWSQRRAATRHDHGWQTRPQSIDHCHQNLSWWVWSAAPDQPPRGASCVLQSSAGPLQCGLTKHLHMCHDSWMIDCIESIEMNLWECNWHELNWVEVNELNLDWIQLILLNGIIDFWCICEFKFACFVVRWFEVCSKCF